MNENEVRTYIRNIEFDISKNVIPSPEQVKFLQTHSRISHGKSVRRGILSCFQFMDDPTNAPFVEPFLDTEDVDIASAAIWTLCWLGEGARFKSYILNAVDPGYKWDQYRDLAIGALYAAGYHLKTHRDRDLAQLLISWLGPVKPDTTASGIGSFTVERMGNGARIAAGTAMGADPYQLTEDDALVEACVQRFIAERQNG